MQNLNTSNPQTLPLDTAGILYSYTKTKTWNQTYRVSANLYDEVNEEFLKQAVRKLRYRFPSFYMRISQGFLWKQLKSAPVDVDDIVVQDKELCSPVNTENKYAPLFKIRYYKKRISLDIFHGITDGHGAITYLKTLLATYFNLQGINIPCTHGILDINESPKTEELEDGYLKFYDKSKGKASRSEKVAYQHYIDDKDGVFSIMQAKVSASEIKNITKALDVSVTEYLVALYAYSYYINKDHRSRKPIKIQYPIDLRNIFGLQTLRNFSLVMSISLPYRKEKYTFEEVLETTVKQISDSKDKNKIQRILNTNAADAAMAITKYSPSFMKQPFIIAGFHLYGERMVTSPISNVGLISAPDELKKLVDYFDLTIGATKMNSINAAVGTFKENMVITFSTKKARREVQKTFFNLLEKHGANIEYTIER